jgi:hypothetical protein
MTAADAPPATTRASYSTDWVVRTVRSTGRGPFFPARVPAVGAMT